MGSKYLYDVTKAGPLESAGSKARKLQMLANGGYRTPKTYVCTWDAFQRYVQDDKEIITLLESEIAGTIDLDRSYAVRSSANLEDSLESSFAGQFKSILNVSGLSEILQAIWAIWASPHSPGVVSYLEKRGLRPSDLNMAVILQEMVHPIVSGVAFSKNPLTGMDETIVEAVKGRGELLVQDGVTPSRWIDKWGAWIVKPEEMDGIAPELMAQVVHETKSIARWYGHPVDLEWVFDGESIYWVQLRDITTTDINVYSNHIAKEVLPGIIKPLVWSVNVPLVNGAWVKLITSLIGPNDIDPHSLAKSFYCRAYFNMGVLGQVFERLGMPRETLELLMGIEIGGPDKPSFKPGNRIFRLLPRILRLVAEKMTFTRKMVTYVPSARRQFEALEQLPRDEMTERELLDAIDELAPLVEEAAYYNIVTPLLLLIYSRALKGQLDRCGVDFETVDLTAGLAELNQFEPNAQLAALHQQYVHLDGATRARIDESTYGEFQQLSGVTELQTEFERFLKTFGHLSDSGNDFSEVPWREEPDVLLRMMIDFAEPNDGAAEMVRFEDLDLPVIRRLVLRPIYRRARTYKLYREVVSSLYTYGYGLFRDYFLALGDRFVRRGAITAREDIFFLQFDQVRDIVWGKNADQDYIARIRERKSEIEACRSILPPSIIYGDEALPMQLSTSVGLKGTPTSRGQYTGPVRVVQGIRDFAKLDDGDVLVIPFSDVGWTPLFTRAGAVIAESGGILSHSSIIAREYRIPAVVSVPGACQLQDGTAVTVDGFRGEIIVHETPES
jgi:pyruvate,water dikinase